MVPYSYRNASKKNENEKKALTYYLLVFCLIQLFNEEKIALTVC